MGVVLPVPVDCPLAIFPHWNSRQQSRSGFSPGSCFVMP